MDEYVNAIYYAPPLGAIASVCFRRGLGAFSWDFAAARLHGSGVPCALRGCPLRIRNA